MIGSDRVQAVAGYDGAFAGWFGVFSRRLGTPVRVTVMSRIAAAIFMIVGVNLNKGSTASTFMVVPYMAISTTQISYIAIFPAAIKLMYSHPDVPRPYRLPGGKPSVDRRRHLHRLHPARILRSGVPGRDREGIRSRVQLQGRLGGSPGCSSRCSRSGRWP